MEYIIVPPLEGTPEKDVATDNYLAYKQIRLEFHIPAIASWMLYAGPELFQHVVQKEGGLQLWIQWEKRLQGIAEEELDDRTKAAAASALENMNAARAHS